MPLRCDDCQVADFLQPALLAGQASITWACMHGCGLGDSPEHVCSTCQKHFFSPCGLVSSNSYPAERMVMSRCLPSLQLPGPTAVQASAQPCHRSTLSGQSGASCICKSGLICGNNVEHLCASLQKVAHKLQYMSGNQLSAVSSCVDQTRECLDSVASCCTCACMSVNTVSMHQFGACKHLQ